MNKKNTQNVISNVVSKKKEEHNVPDLRFSKFLWKKVVFRDIASFFKGNGLSKEQLSSEGNDCILYGELYTKYIPGPINNIISKTNFIPSNAFYSKNNDIILPSSGESNLDISIACCVKKDNVILGGDLNVIRSNKHDGSFLCYQLIGKRKLDIAKIAQGASIVHLHNSDLEKLHLYIPSSYDDELKIASLLNLISDRIVTQKKIINNLQSLINGIINESFSEKGLFKEGNLVSLKDILLEGNKVPVDTKFYKKITIKLNKEGVVFSNITREMSDTRPFYIREKGELIIGKQNYFNGSIALISEEYDQTICSNAIMSFKIKNSYNNDFIYYCISNNLFLKYRSHLANGTGQKELSEKDFLSFVIRLPDQSTQVKIVRRINLVTQKLNAEKKILLLYEKQKQYLLDKLFI